MESKNVQKVVLSKYEKDDGTTKIFQDLNGAISLSTIKRWRRRTLESGSINLSKPLGCLRIIRTKGAIEKVKTRLNRRDLVSSRKLTRELGISRSNVQRILKNDLKIQAKMNQWSQMSIKQKDKNSQTGYETNFRKEDTMKILFSDEKLFDIDGI